MNVESFGISSGKSGSNSGDTSSTTVRTRQAKAKATGRVQPLQNNAQSANYAESKSEDRCGTGACEITWKPSPMRAQSVSSNG